MKFDGNESQLLKDWVVQRLNNTASDAVADSDVLADYVLALVETEDADTVVRSNCVENLKDFLQDATESFVDDIFAAIKSKSYDAPAQKSVAQIQPLDSRKRGFEDENAQDGRIQSYEGGDRPMKQPRRGGQQGGYEGRGGRGGYAPAHHQQWQPPYAAQMSPMQQVPQMPAPLPAMPQFDPSDPMAMLMAMQAMGMPPMPQMHGAQPTAPKKRCYDYDKKGFCARGAACLYEHGEDAFVVPANEPYDPSNSALPGYKPPSNFGRGGARGRGRGRGSGLFKGPAQRADISHLGPMFDRTNRTIVVEQIPEEKLGEQAVRDFFSQYGEIEEVTIQPYKRLATVKFVEYDAACDAYNSPRVIFDNRFVKVYWYKPGIIHNSNFPPPSESESKTEVVKKEQEPEMDLVEVAKRQEEAQRKHEETMKQRANAEQQSAEIAAKLKAMEAQRAKMAEKLVKKTARTDSPAAQSPTPNGESEKTKGLKEQLARLEAEAKIAGIDPAAANGWGAPPPYRSRGGFRGRGGFAPRGSGFNPGYRGGWNAGALGGAVKRLDNRPRTVSVVFPDGTYDQHDEAMRQYLLLTDSLDHATLSKHPDRADAVLVAFEERYRAENFMVAAGTQSGIPHIGTVELAWQANAPVAATTESNGHEAQEEATNMIVDEVEQPAAMTDAFDVADDDDRW